MEYKELGKVVRKLPPDSKAKNPRNSEGTFLETEEDGILFVYSRFRGKDPADHAYADLCLMRSMDEGRTFDEGRIILTCDGEDGVNMMSPSLLRMGNGDVRSAGAGSGGASKRCALGMGQDRAGKAV